MFFTVFTLLTHGWERVLIFVCHESRLRSEPSGDPRGGTGWGRAIRRATWDVYRHVFPVCHVSEG